MRTEAKYHKVISLTLLLFFLATIHHYSAAFYEKVVTFQLNIDQTHPTEIKIPEVPAHKAASFRNISVCQQQVCSNSCLSKTELNKNG